MATKTIKGISVRIGADTSDFIKQLKKVDKEINYSEKQARELQKQLEFKFDEKTFLTAQAKVRDDLEATEQKAKAIKQQLKYLEDSGGIDSKGYKDLQVELEKNTTQAMKLNAELEKLDNIKFENAFKGIKTLSSNLETAAKKTAVLSAGAVGLITGISKLGSSTATAGAEIQDMADRLGVTAEAIQRYDYIALQSGVDTEQLAKSMAKARDAIGTALAGTTNTATTALQNLFGDLRNIPTDTEAGFAAIIDQLSKVEDSTLQAYYANEIFGERLATNLIPMINNGADKLAKFNAEFESIGYLSNEQVQALADFDDELNIMKERLELAKNKLGIAMLPLLERFADIVEKVIVPAIQKLADWFDSLPEPMQNVITGGLMLFAALSPILFIMSKMTGVIPTLVKWFNSLSATSWKTYLGFASLGGAIGLVFDLIGNWSELSALGKVLRLIGVAALTAAAAMTIFHASWSLGVAVGIIAASVTAGIAAINSAGKSIGLDTNFSDTNSVENAYANQNYSIPKDYSSGGYSSYTEDNSQYTININADLTGNLEYDTKTLADSVIKEIVTKKQASGR